MTIFGQAMKLRLWAHVSMLAVTMGGSAWATGALFQCAENRYVVATSETQHASLLQSGCSIHPGPFDSNRWTTLGATDKYTVFFDPASVKAQDIYTKAWFLTVYESRQIRDGGSYNSAKSLILFQCARGTSALQKLIYYDDPFGEGSVVGSGTTPDGELMFSDPVPGSVKEKMLQAACRAGSK